MDIVADKLLISYRDISGGDLCKVQTIYVFLGDRGVIISLNLLEFQVWRPIYCRINGNNF